jgi:glycosyltransferase involved in cell wall biosynthesis
MLLSDSELFSYIAEANIPGRTTFFVASGEISGDSNLFLEFSKLTSSVFLSFSNLSNQSFKSCDLVIFVNIDNPFPFTSYLSAYPLPCQTLLYTLYHPRAGIIELFLYKNFKLVLPRFLTTALPLEYFYNLLKYFPYLDSFSPGQIFRHLLHPLDVIANRFSFLCCATFGEAQSVATFTSLAPKNIFLQSHLPLALPQEFYNFTHPNPYFLTVGRAESRKNLLNLVKIVPSFPNFDFIIVSSPSLAEPTIIEMLRLFSNSYPNFFLFEDLSTDQIYFLIKSSFCVVNTSYFEVSSLIDVTAMSLSVPLITSSNSYIPSLSSVFFHYPANSSSLSAAITTFLSSWAPRKIRSALALRRQ